MSERVLRPGRAAVRPRAARDGGFTLVELMVVVLIIGILAAIAVPILIGVRDGASDASSRSDLINSRIALQNYVTSTGGGWPTISGSDGAANAKLLRSYGWSGAGVVDDSSAAGGAPDAYCVAATSGSGTTFYLTQSVSPTSARPPGCR